MKFSIKKSFDIVFSTSIAALCVLLFFLPTGFEDDWQQNNHSRYKAKVLDVNNEDLRRAGLLLLGTQMAKVLVMQGEYKGDTLVATNVLNGQMSYDQYYEAGDLALLTVSKHPQTGKPIKVMLQAPYRTHLVLILFGIFAGFLVLYSGWTGAKALLSFVFTALAMWKILIPGFLNGINPVLLSLGITYLCTASIIILITGFTRKGVVAFSGAMLGISITAVLSLVFGHYFAVPGTVRDFAEMILYAGYLNLSLTQIFLSGIFISAAGAVMDVAMDIAASQEEIVRENPHISTKNLMKAGFRIGHAVIGTMTTTLLFAYSGNFTFVMMMFMSQGTPLETILNTNFVAGEILQTLVGSFGLVLVAPITAIVGGIVYTYKGKSTLHR